MRSRSALTAATRRRAIPGRAARESRARKRTLLSRARRPPDPLAPFVAGAPFAAGPPREPLALAPTFACSARTSERTDLALSTRLASRRSTGTSSESWPEPLTVPFNQCSSGLHRTLSDVRLGLVNGRCRATVAAGADRPRSPAARRAESLRQSRESRPHAARRVRLALRTNRDSARNKRTACGRAVARRQDGSREPGGPECRDGRRGGAERPLE